MPIFTRNYTELHGITRNYTELHGITRNLVILFLMLTFGSTCFAQVINDTHSSCATSYEEGYEKDIPNSSRSTNICTGSTDVKYININFHFIQNAVGLPLNFTKEDDGQNNVNYTGYDRAEDYVHYMNIKFQTNAKMRLPANNNIPSNNNTDNPPVRIQYILRGVYFHKTDEYDNDGISDWRMLDELGVNQDTEVNVFMINEPGEYYDGIATCDLYSSTCINNGGLGVKIWKGYNEYLNGIGVWETAKLINHECGHTFGLRHTWNYNDLCTDTPLNNNCLGHNYPNPSPITSPCNVPSCCNDLYEVSNNLMDYNTNKGAITPQQITRMHNRLNSNFGNAYVHSCDDCDPTNSFFYLPESICLANVNSSILLDGRGSWKETSYRFEIMQVPSVGSTQQINGSLFISNVMMGEVDVFDLNTLNYTFSPGTIHQVRLYTFNECGNGVSVSIGWIIIENGNEECEEDNVSIIEPPGTPPGHEEPRLYLPSIPIPIEMSFTINNESNDESSNNTEQPLDIIITPNPAKDIVEITYQVIDNSNYQLRLVSIFGEQLQILEQGTSSVSENRSLQFDSSIYPSGVYVIVLTTDEGKQAKQLIITK